MRKEEWREATAAQSPATITTTTAAATTRAMNIEATSVNAEVPQKYQASFHILGLQKIIEVRELGTKLDLMLEQELA